MKNHFYNCPLLKVVIYLTFFLFLMFTCVGSNITETDTLNIALKMFKDYDVTIDNSVTQINPSRINIHIDITGSIKGFMGDNSTLYNILQKLSFCTNQKDVKWYAFHESLEEKNGHVPFLNIFAYEAQEADYNLLNEYFGENQLSIIFTDLQFNSAEYLSALVKIFQDMIKEDRFIKVFNTKLDFSGRYFPEGYSDQYYDTFIGKRPYYAIVIGGKHHAEYINELMGVIHSWENDILFTKYTKSVLIIDELGSAFLDYGRINDRGETSLLKINSVSPLESTISLKNTNFKDWISFEEKNIRISEYYFETIGDSILSKSNDFTYDISNINLDGDVLKFSLKTRRLNIKGLKLYRIIIVPDYISGWVRDLTCNIPDGYEAQRDHTLWIEDFFTGIISRIDINDPYALTSAYLIIKN